MLTEIEQRTVHFRPNYDGTRTEPVVLPARIPNLLSTARPASRSAWRRTFRRITSAKSARRSSSSLENPDLTTAQLCRWVKGPDFPTGGQILNSAEELKEIYKTGSGAIRLRGTWKMGEPDAQRQARLHHQRSVHGQQGCAGRADRGDRPQPETAAARGRQGHLDRRRAD